MQSWRERCEKCVCLQGDYVEKWLHFQLPVASSFLNKLGDLRNWTPNVTRRSAFFELSHPRTHIFHVHNVITACLTQLSMNFDWFHATQVEESDNHALFFECKRRHFSIKNTTAIRPRHKHSTGSTVLSIGLAQPKEQSRLLQQLPGFYLLPFPRKKLGYLRTWTPHVQYIQNDWSALNSDFKRFSGNLWIKILKRLTGMWTKVSENLATYKTGAMSRSGGGGGLLDVRTQIQ